MIGWMRITEVVGAWRILVSVVLGDDGWYDTQATRQSTFFSRRYRRLYECGSVLFYNFQALFRFFPWICNLRAAAGPFDVP